jgi:hypothetical protein
MTSLHALGLCTAVSLLVSAALITAIREPLRDFIARACPGLPSQAFWLRFTTIMLVLSPLFIAVTWGIPRQQRLRLMEFGELIQNIATASLVGAFLSMLVMGLWVSSLSRRIPAAANNVQ